MPVIGNLNIGEDITQNPPPPPHHVWMIPANQTTIPAPTQHWRFLKHPLNYFRGHLTPHAFLCKVLTIPCSFPEVLP